jgi:glycerate 2-kinase
MKIKNRDKLISKGDTSAREVMLEIIESSLQALDSYDVIRDLLTLDRDILRIGSCQWNLARKRRLFVIGAGKACNSMARAVEERLADRISGGLVIVKHIEPGDDLGRIELALGGHPLPNEDGFRASQRLLDMVEQANTDDLFIGLISGGSSALMNCPVSGITLDDEIRLTNELLKSSARIGEINAVRRHISNTNGGRLAKRIEAKGAEMINLIISDGVGARPTTDPGQPVKFFGTPVASDDTTLQDARDVLSKYNLYSRVPRSIVEFLEFENSTRETPKDLGDRIHHFVIQRPANACETAKRVAKTMGLEALILTTVLEGESREAGTFLACVAKEITLNHRPIASPCVLIAGGETTTKVDEEFGLGGPSQELALGFALEIVNRNEFCMAALDTDGTDGPTTIAGGLVDGTTVIRARQKGIDAYDSLRAHDSSGFFTAIGDEIITGNTGTNVCDLNVIYIS